MLIFQVDTVHALKRIAHERQIACALVRARAISELFGVPRAMQDPNVQII